MQTCAIVHMSAPQIIFSKSDCFWPLCGTLNSLSRLQACHHARLRKGRWAAPAPLRGPCGVLDPACAWWRALGVGTGNVFLVLRPAAGRSNREWELVCS